MTPWYFGISLLSEKTLLYPNIDMSARLLIRGLLPFAAISALLFIFRKEINFKQTAFAFIWFILFLFPTYAMFNNNYYTHRLYIPIIGVFIILTDIFIVVYRKYPSLKKVFYITILCIFVFFSFYTYRQCRYYKDRSTFWLQAYYENKNSPKINIELANYYIMINDLDKAEELVLSAQNLMDTNVNKSSSFLLLGKIYQKRKNYSAASHYYIKAIEENPSSESNYFALSMLHAQLGNKKAAVEIIEKAIEILPKSNKIKRFLNHLNEKN
jgi:tetratricopeptide (TPR) repeat protein